MSAISAPARRPTPNEGPCVLPRRASTTAASTHLVRHASTVRAPVLHFSLGQRFAVPRLRARPLLRSMGCRRARLRCPVFSAGSAGTCVAKRRGTAARAPPLVHCTLGCCTRCTARRAPARAKRASKHLSTRGRRLAGGAPHPTPVRRTGYSGKPFVRALHKFVVCARSRLGALRKRCARAQILPARLRRPAPGRSAGVFPRTPVCCSSWRVAEQGSQGTLRATVRGPATAASHRRCSFTPPARASPMCGAPRRDVFCRLVFVSSSFLRGRSSSSASSPARARVAVLFATTSRRSCCVAGLDAG